MNNLLNNRQHKNTVQIQTLRNEQKMREHEKINDLSNVDQNKLRDIIIGQVTIDKDNKDFKFKLKQKEEEYKSSTIWANRTNIPYKGILSLNEIEYKKNINSVNDLIIHKVTNLDKQETNNKYKEIQNNIKQHNEELKTKFSESEKQNNKAKFNYIHRRRQGIANKNDFNDLKILSSTNKDNNVQLNDLIADGIFNNDELKKYGLV